MNPVIEVDRLGKRFWVDTVQSGTMHHYRTFREELARWVTTPIRKFRKEPTSSRRREFWAISDLSFEVEPGEVLGIIGRNGAGKSTLLKILSRITSPSRGEVRLRGRVGSLLEVGTGFHPELTGRENIFLNGAILGMKRSEIQRKFEQIVEFAEVADFLDTPVKRYSSGMYIRLAFAVAAHLEPEILIVDEVLAVGDTGFQRKCMSRMREVGRSGCTVLFVSHNMPTIETLCSRVMLLDGGKWVMEGTAAEVVPEYHRRVLAQHAGESVLADRNDPGRKIKVYRSAALRDEADAPTNIIPLGGLFRLELGIDCPQRFDDYEITIGVDDTLGNRMLSVRSPATRPFADVLAGRGTLDIRVPNFPLAPGDYWVKLGLVSGGVEIDEVERVLRFSVTDGDAFGEGRGIHRGVCVAPSNWTYSAAP